jgi:uncharacterized protein YbbC (DUF1343 family)/CubicO group peptidase (beta-lactamase class C family)
MRLLACALVSVAAFAQTFAGSQALDDTIRQAIEQKKIPGAVLAVGHNGQIVHLKAYGKRALEPRPEAMTVDTIFDCASLTKVVATTSAMMKLLEQGKYRLNDKVTEYIPEFQGGKSDITVRNLLTHFSGLRPDVDTKPEWSGYETGIRLATIDKPTSPPGARFVYSDINFILLGEIVRRLSGQPLPDFAREQVFLPLGMKESLFRPPAPLVPRIAPTERPAKDKPPLRGVVHDPTTRFMGGIAGHAGLFSTAHDLARFAQMMLNRGELDGVRIFSPLTVEKFTTPQTPPDQPILRGLGWDIDSPYSGNRGELFPIGSFGHTGFTGTSIWIDPVTRSFVILLANSVHPALRPPITPVRGKVATIAAAALGVDAQRVAITGYNETMSGAGIRRDVGRNGETRSGIDVLAAANFAPLRGRRVGLITNHTGIDRAGKRTLDVLREAGVTVSTVFSPEHGFLGVEDREGLANSRDTATGLTIFSLYGETRRPTPDMLKSVDVLVFDIQDIGARFYTYVTTLAFAMEEAAKAKIPFVVLDRPNPITGVKVEGPLLDKANESFVGYFAGLPVRHGMTIGELARMFNVERSINADLTVVAMQDWNRGDWFDSTTQPWVNPSPNMRSLKAATLYPGLCLMEYSKNWSVGRGTEAPFEQVGASFIRGPELAAYLNKRLIPGVRAYPTRFTPTESNYKGLAIDGVRFLVTNREMFDATRLGLELAVAVQKLYPGKIDFAASKRLIGSDEVVRMIAEGQDPRAIQQSFQDAVWEFLKIRDRYLIYR